VSDEGVVTWVGVSDGGWQGSQRGEQWLAGLQQRGLEVACLPACLSIDACCFQCAVIQLSYPGSPPAFLHTNPTYVFSRPVRPAPGRLTVLVMMAVGVVLIPVRASQLYSRLAARRITAGVLPRSAGGASWMTGRRARPHLVVSGALSDVRGFNDWLQDCLMQVGRVVWGWGLEGQQECAHAWELVGVWCLEILLPVLSVIHGTQQHCNDLLLTLPLLHPAPGFGCPAPHSTMQALLVRLILISGPPSHITLMPPTLLLPWPLRPHTGGTLTPVVSNWAATGVPVHQAFLRVLGAAGEAQGVSWRGRCGMGALLVQPALQVGGVSTRVGGQQGWHTDDEKPSKMARCKGVARVRAMGYALLQGHAMPSGCSLLQAYRHTRSCSCLTH
jgi:hypothetical protein